MDNPFNRRKRRLRRLEIAIEQTVLELPLAELNEQNGVRTQPSRAKLMREDLERALRA